MFFNVNSEECEYFGTSIKKDIWGFACSGTFQYWLIRKYWLHFVYYYLKKNINTTRYLHLPQLGSF